jgi:hypothetical protein
MSDNTETDRQSSRAVDYGVEERRQWLEESVRANLVPVFVKLGFSTRMPERGERDIPPWGRLSRLRECGVIDLVEVQFSSHGRAAFRINACAVPKEGLRTVGGRRVAEELEAGGLHNHFETVSRPWLRSVPVVRAFADWFSVWPRPYRNRSRSDYENLVVAAGMVVPEVDMLLRGSHSGPHIRRIEFPAAMLKG